MACGGLSIDAGDVDVQPLPVTVGALARFAAFMEGIVAAALRQATEDDQKHLEEIRHFFLHPKETYSVEELSNLWRIHPDDVRDIHHDELLRRAPFHTEAGDAPRIARADAVATGVNFNILRPFDVERALGTAFAHVRGEAWGTVPILVHVPTFIAEAVAVDPSIPPNLPIDVRLEQIILEVFAGSEYSAVAQGAREGLPEGFG